MKNDLENLVGRIEKLEAVVFGKNEKIKVVPKDFSGITGGVRFLESKGFFNHDHSLSEIKTELFKNGYRSSIQAVQIALIRLSKAGGPLIAFKDSGKKRYAKRK